MPLYLIKSEAERHISKLMLAMDHNAVASLGSLGPLLLLSWLLRSIMRVLRTCMSCKFKSPDLTYLCHSFYLIAIDVGSQLRNAFSSESRKSVNSEACAELSTVK